MNSTDFKERYLGFYPKLYRIAFCIVGNEMEAEDIVQDVYAKFWDIRDTLPNISNPEAYCITVLKNTALQALRSRHHNNTVAIDVEDNAELIESDTGQPAETVESREALNSVIEIIEHLPPQQREVLRLRAIADLSFDEIHQVTGLSCGNIRSLLSRGRTRLKEIYFNKLKH